MSGDNVYRKFALPFYQAEKQRAEQLEKQLHLEKQRAEQEKQRAEQEKQRAEQEKQRAERLAEKLKSLGISADE